MYAAQSIHYSPSPSLSKLQAARVSNACKRLIASGPEVRGRPQSYNQSAQLDLDSYVNLVQAIKLRVSILHVEHCVVKLHAKVLTIAKMWP